MAYYWTPLYDTIVWSIENDNGVMSIENDEGGMLVKVNIEGSQALTANRHKVM